MAAVNDTMSVWVPVGTTLGSAALLVTGLVTLLCLSVRYSSVFKCCPCNRRRGRAQLVVTKKDGEMRNRDHFQTSSGVTMFVPPRLLNQSSSSTLTPPTPSTSTSLNTCNSYTHLFPPPTTDHTQFCADQPPSSHTDSCSYMLPNGMTQLSDGFEISSSWQKCTNRIGTVPLLIVSRSRAENMLRTQGKVGGYLFRQTTDNNVCLSALAEKNGAPMCRHLLLVEDTEGKIKIDSLPDGCNAFSSLSELEKYYRHNGIHFEDGGLSLTLIMPILHSEPLNH